MNWIVRKGKRLSLQKLQGQVSGNVVGRLDWIALGRASLLSAPSAHDRHPIQSHHDILACLLHVLARSLALTLGFGDRPP